MSEPLAYFISWTTHGTWLSGDDRGWVDRHTPGIQAPDPQRHDQARRSLSEPPVTLNQEQRQVVKYTVQEHCKIRNWTLHAVNPRSNHIHVVVTAAGVPPEKVMDQFKSWCSRRLNELLGRKRKYWWTYHGSTKWINDEEYLRNAITYVLERQ